jgi:hypothetical protein
MPLPSLHSKYIYLVTALALGCVCVAVTLLNYRDWFTRSYFGDVVSENNTSLTITDPREGTRTFVIDGFSTILTKPDGTPITVGDSVIVVSDENGEGIQTVNVVRPVKKRSGRDNIQNEEGVKSP